MRCLKVLKHENSIMELSITNGLIFILKENDVPFELESLDGAYLIHISDDLDFNDLVLPEIDIDRLVKSSNSSFNKTENEKFYKNFIDLLLGQDNENLALTFKYFETLDEEYLNQGEKKAYLTDTDKEILIGLNTTTTAKMIGTRTYSRGIRKLSTPSPSQVNEKCINVVLSVLGFLISSNYLRIGDDLEINMMYKPKKTDDLIVPKFKSFLDKETGEYKDLTMIKGVPKNIGLAELYLLSIQKLNIDFIKDSYDGVCISTVKPSGNKPMADKSINLPILNVSDKFLEKFINLLTWKDVDFDVKFSIADYFLSQDLESFFNLIHVIGKSKKTVIRKNILMELINLQIEKVQYIYRLDSIKKLGRGLNRLISDGKGYSIQVDLLNCSEIDKLSKIIQDITLLYTRSYKSPRNVGYKLINSKELMEILLSMNCVQDVKTVASALITYSSIYVEKKEKEEEIEETEEINE